MKIIEIETIKAIPLKTAASLAGCPRFFLIARNTHQRAFRNMECNSVPRDTRKCYQRLPSFRKLQLLKRGERRQTRLQTSFLLRQVSKLDSLELRTVFGHILS